MIDVVIPLGKGSRLKDFELRFCLRAIEKYLSGYRNIYIIGERPDWLQNIFHIHVDDTSSIPDFNIMTKITAACNEKEVTEDFIMFNDDHFLLSNFTANSFPFYYNGQLDSYVKRRGLDGYGRRANNTLKTLQTLGLPIKYYDIHTPIIYNKEAFITNVTKADWHGKKDGFIIKSLYANSVQVEGTELRDNKINHPPIINDKLFSTYPYLKASVTRFISEKFPDKSNYERTGI